MTELCSSIAIEGERVFKLRDNNILEGNRKSHNPDEIRQFRILEKEIIMKFIIVLNNCYSIRRPNLVNAFITVLCLLLTNPTTYYGYLQYRTHKYLNLQ